MVHALAVNLEHSVPTEKARVISAPQSEQLERMPELFCQKGKGQSN